MELVSYETRIKPQRLVSSPALKAPKERTNDLCKRIVVHGFLNSVEHWAKY